MTSTPSATAWSIAATMSEVRLPDGVLPLAVHSALYTAMEAAGATPEILPKLMPSTVPETLASPPAVEAVCVPWLSPMR